MNRLVPAVLCLLLLLCAVSCGKATTAPPSFSGGPSEAGSSEGPGNTSKEASPASSPYSQTSLPSEAPVLLETDSGDSRKLLLSVTLPEDAGREKPGKRQSTGNAREKVRKTEKNLFMIQCLLLKAEVHSLQTAKRSGVSGPLRNLP